MNVGSLFSGIGGLDLGLERAGMHVRWQCEIDPYCRAVLAHHWPGIPCYGDIRDIDESAERVDLICGGFPCQPVSLAGRGRGAEDPRWMWPEFARVVGLLRPRYVLVENVPGLVKRGLDLVVTGLAQAGYDAEWETVSAASRGAPHLRERLFIVATARTIAPDPGSVVRAWGQDRSIRDVQDSDASERGESLSLFARSFDVRAWRAWESEPSLDRMAYGIPRRMDRLRVLGNAVVPQVAQSIGEMLMREEGTTSSLPPPITDGRDPGDEHYDVPTRCVSCDRYCDGRCPRARKENK